ncbi:hypothetical protein SAMN05192532_105248 [Alteribacillus iranensis]|uniref:Uncharacterized protein n=1 Tax=Alteribacillus iranensis TaxID=930128 RepID=A0A1I2ECG3_9BACI|nr:hypothetical protein SAMN05192532_105248 [Alteribacillus iranensis]
MFVNAMLSIWLYGFLASLAIVGVSLWKWYFKD